MPSEKSPSTATDPAAGAGPDSRPAYEPPRLVKKRAVQRATLFSGGGGGPPSSPQPLVATG